MSDATPSVWAEPFDLLDDELALLLDSPRFDDELLLSTPVATKTRRKRPRDSLVNLRAEVAKLEAELAGKRRAVLEKLQDERVAVEKQVTDWEAMARRQMQQVEEARGTNARLRATLEHQVALAKSLHAAVQQHCMLARVCGIGPWPGGRLPPPSKDEILKSAELFKALTIRTLELYEQADDVLKTAKFVIGVETNAVKIGGGSSYLEIANAWRLPFEVEAVDRAQWRGLSINSVGIPRGAGRLADMGSDVFHYVYYEPLQLSQFSNCTVTGKMAIRRFAEPHRVIIIWTAVVGVNRGVHCQIREEGWATITPVLIAGNPSGSTLVQSLARLAYEGLAGELDENKHQHRHEVMDFILGAYRRKVKVILEAMENELLTEIRNSQDSSNSRLSRLKRSAGRYPQAHGKNSRGT